MISPQRRSCHPARVTKDRLPSSFVQAFFVLAYTPLPDALSDPDQAKDTPDISLLRSWASGFPLPSGKEPVEVLFRIHYRKPKPFASAAVVTDLVFFVLAPTMRRKALDIVFADWLPDARDIHEL